LGELQLLFSHRKRTLDVIGARAGDDAWPLDHNPPDFVEYNPVAGVLVELGGLEALVGSNLLGLLEVWLDSFIERLT
jgi:hypothetical protein